MVIGQPADHVFFCIALSCVEYDRLKSQKTWIDQVKTRVQESPILAPVIYGTWCGFKSVSGSGSRRHTSSL